MRKKVVLIIILIILGLVAYSLGRQVYESLQVNNRLDTATEELLTLQKKNTDLKKELERVKTIGFIEKQARDKLNFAREGETVVIIPQAEIDKVLGVEKKIEEIKLPNWQGWWKLFTH